MKQLALGIALPKSATFSTYYGKRNEQAVATIQQLIACTRTDPVFLYGNAGSGKTHLLQATCNSTANRNGRALYFSLTGADSMSPEILSELETLDLVALDDLQYAAGNADWERALFGLFNALGDTNTPLLLAADVNPNGLAIELPDLRSRLCSCTVFRLEELTDSEKIGALQMQAQRRGMNLSDEVGRYLLSRVRRDMGSLLEILERLDEASLAAQRRITIPFVREVLDS